MENFSEEYNSLLTEYKTRLAYCLDMERFNDALEQMYSLMIDSDDVLKGELKTLYIETLKRFYESMRDNVMWSELFHYWEQSLQLYPDCIYLNHQLGLLLIKAGVPSKAAPYFHKAHLLDPTEVNVKIDFENLKNDLVERWHFVMLNDVKRNRQFKGAIESAIRAGYDSILDIGAGSGILSMCAAKGGASEVYACELSATMYDIGQGVLKINNLDQRVNLIEKCSINMNVPEDIPHRVSLVVTETFDAGLLGENILTTVNHAWKHLLLPPGQGGKIIPEKATVFFALVECPYIRRKAWFQGNKVGPLNLSHIRLLQKEAKYDPYMTENISQVGGFSYLSAVQPLCQINFNDPQQISEWHKSKVIEKQVTVTSKGHLDALVIWFELDLGYGFKIATSPDDVTCWEQAAFPILPSHLSDLRVKGGDSFEVKLECVNHFYLRSVSRASTSHPEGKSHHTDIILAGDIIQRLNNDYYLSYHLDALKNIPWNKKLTVLDVSPVPWMGLVAYKYGAKKIIALKNDSTNSIKTLMGKLGIPKDAIQFEHAYELEPKQQHNVILFDPIMGTGVIHYVDHKFFLSKPNFFLVPRTLPFFACLINSRDLLLMSRVVDDNKTLGFKIAELINLYQTRVQQDIIFSTLPHTKLSDTLNLGPIPFTEEKLVSTFRVKPRSLGTVTAVAFWFGEEGAFGSQSICLLDEEMVIESLEENLELEYVLEHCYLEFSLRKI